MRYILSVFVFLVGVFGFVPTSVFAVASCPLTVGGAYKTSASPAVYYVTENCTKQLLNQDQYFSYFDSWNDTHVVSQAILTSVKTDAMPATMGPQYFPRTGSLIKSPTNSTVYFVLSIFKSKIANTDLLAAMGLDAAWVETVPQATLDKFLEGDEVNTIDEVFSEGLYLFQYTDNPTKVYLLLPDTKTGRMMRHFVKNETLLDYIGYRRDRIPMLPPVYQFQIGAPIDNIGEFFTQYFTDTFTQMFSGLGNSFSEDLFTRPLLDNSLTSPLDLFSYGIESPTEFIENDEFDESQNSEIKYLKVDDNFDHIMGNKKAKVTLIEYADFECPYCKQFHTTMKQAMEKYGDRVRWVFRQFPIESIHSQARAEALASECAGEQGQFWKFADILFANTQGEDTLDLSKLQLYAAQAGVDVPTFNECYKTEKYAQKVDEDIADAQSAGAQGTPYTLLFDINGQVKPLSGAIPFSELDAEIQAAL